MLYNVTYLILEKKNIPLQRYSCDKGRVNKYGNLLLECCKRCGLFICNGRIFTDRTIGRQTCRFNLKDPGPQPLRNPQKQGAILDAMTNPKITLGLTRGG
jgi:hypothetical protein